VATDRLETVGAATVEAATVGAAAEAVAAEITIDTRAHLWDREAHLHPHRENLTMVEGGVDMPHPHPLRVPNNLIHQEVEDAEEEEEKEEEGGVCHPHRQVWEDPHHIISGEDMECPHRGI
jgi:hypothetical protein